jgi:hypothetical protein
VQGHTSGAPAGKTGSPADASNCTSCHSGTPTSQAGLITSTIPVSGYIPGQTYTVTGSVTDATVVKFGFEISPQKTTGTLTGTMIRTDATHTQFVVGTGNKYITHTSVGTSYGGHTATWSFQWTAPVAGTGNFTFYGAFNLTNANNASSGDRTVLSQLAIIENITAGITSLEDESSFSVFPNPASDKVTVNLKKHNDNASAQLMDINGAVVKNIAEIGSSSNEFNVSDLPAGTYFLSVYYGETVSTKKVIKL